MNPRGIEDAVVPERYPAVHAGAEQAVLASEGVEAPQFFTRSRIEREESETWRRPIESSVDDDGVALDLAAILGVGATRVVAPRELERADVADVDLIEHRRLARREISKISGPVDIGRRCASDRQGAANGQRDAAQSSLGARCLWPSTVWGR